MTFGKFRRFRARAGVVLAVLAVVLYAFALSAREADSAYGGYTVQASYYGEGDWYDLTASGEVFDPNDWSAAHPLAGTASMPFGTKVKVCGPTGCARGVRINDVGPAEWTGRGLDVSEGVAVRIGLIAPGHAAVTYYPTGGYTNKWKWD